MAHTVIVLGAGVSGLTTALLLARDAPNTITVVARDMPGDYNAEYASPWAGANFIPLDGSTPNPYDKQTWTVLKDLATFTPEAGIHFQKLKLQRRTSSQDLHSGFGGAFVKDPWFRTLFDDFAELDKSELTPGYDAGYSFTTVCINPPVYLAWLVGQCAKQRVEFRRATVSHIRDARLLSHSGRPADFIINCTGLGSLKLGGVNDTKMIPIRGQTVLVANKAPSMLMYSSVDDMPGDEMYVMERALGGGTILGGTYEVGKWDPYPDPNTALRIMQRVVSAVPSVAGGQGVKGLNVVRHGVGLRPHREGGVRVEKEWLDGGICLIHNYGHSSWGYIGSYGCAQRVVELLHETLRTGEGRYRPAPRGARS